MAYWIRYKDTANGAYTTLTLYPGPTEVEYPEKRDMQSKATVDGATVIQRPLKDTRPRQWVWKGYPPTLPGYANLWTTLQTLEYRTRLELGKHPLVEIWEDVIPDAGFGRLDGSSNKIWTVVKFLRVERTPRKGGGNVRYEDSVIEFVIEDAAYTGF